MLHCVLPTLETAADFCPQDKGLSSSTKTQLGLLSSLHKAVARRVEPNPHSTSSSPVTVRERTSRLSLSLVPFSLPYCSSYAHTQDSHASGSNTD